MFWRWQDMYVHAPSEIKTPSVSYPPLFYHIRAMGAFHCSEAISPPSTCVWPMCVIFVFGSRTSAPPRFLCIQPHFSLPTVASSAVGLNLRVLLAFLASFSASFKACFSRPFSRFSHFISLDIPYFFLIFFLTLPSDEFWPRF